MMEYIKAENLKCKRTFAKKMVLMAPLFMVALASCCGQYFAENGYNWWYTMILPGYITLITALINQNEEKKLRYRAVFALPASLRKTWIAKIMLIGIYIAAACIIHLTGMILGKTVYFTRSTITIYQMLAATLILIIISLWQVPLCLFLSKKFGMMAAILINVAGGIFLGIFTASKSFWWTCPYSWETRLMCPVLGIMPNGELAKSGDPLLNSGVVPVGIIMSIVLFILLLLITAKWFFKQEVK